MDRTVSVLLLAGLCAVLQETLVVAPAVPKSQCPIVNQIPVEANFDWSRFKRRWFTQKYNKFVPIKSRENTAQAINNMDNTDLQSFLQEKANGEWEVLNAGQMKVKLPGGSGHAFCFYSRGNVTKESEAQQAKLKLEYLVWSPTDKKWVVHNFNYWIVKTDYDHYAVIYSCQEQTADGRCNPNKAYIWTLTRSRKRHTPAQERDIKKIADDLCVDHSTLKDVAHDQNGETCVLDENNFKTTTGLV